MTLIIGSEGRIGRRYKAIFNYLDKPFTTCDIQLNNHLNMMEMATRSDRILLCTPTDTHYRILVELINLKKPILCEKPITKDFDELKNIFQHAQLCGTDLKMVLQYKEIAHSQRPGQLSYYDYFNHGPDGKYWDMMQVIGLAKGNIRLGETSPIWRCMINGEEIKFNHMDHAYINMIDRWLGGTLDQDQEEIVRIHRKVMDFIDAATDNE